MNILITGAKGFAGRNLVANLYTIKDGKNRTRPEIKIDNIFALFKICFTILLFFKVSLFTPSNWVFKAII